MTAAGGGEQKNNPLFEHTISKYLSRVVVTFCYFLCLFFVEIDKVILSFYGKINWIGQKNSEKAEQSLRSTVTDF